MKDQLYPVYEDFNLHNGKFEWVMKKQSEIDRRKYKFYSNGIYIRRSWANKNIEKE